MKNAKSFIRPVKRLALAKRPLIKKLINKTKIIIIRVINKIQNIIKDIIKTFN